jgi:hypothetical protein
MNGTEKTAFFRLALVWVLVLVTAFMLFRSVRSR